MMQIQLFTLKWVCTGRKVLWVHSEVRDKVLLCFSMVVNDFPLLLFSRADGNPGNLFQDDSFLLNQMKPDEWTPCKVKRQQYGKCSLSGYERMKIVFFGRKTPFLFEILSEFSSLFRQQFWTRFRTKHLLFFFYFLFVCFQKTLKVTF